MTTPPPVLLSRGSTTTAYLPCCITAQLVACTAGGSTLSAEPSRAFCKALHPSEAAENGIKISGRGRAGRAAGRGVIFRGPPPRPLINGPTATPPRHATPRPTRPRLACRALSSSGRSKWLRFSPRPAPTHPYCGPRAWPRVLLLPPASLRSAPTIYCCSRWSEPPRPRSFRVVRATRAQRISAVTSRVRDTPFFPRRARRL